MAVAFAILFATDFGLPIAEWFMCLIPDVIISTLMTGVVLIVLESIVWSAFMALSLLMASLRRGCLIRKLGKV